MNSAATLAPVSSRNRAPVIVDPKPAQWLHAIKIATNLIRLLTAMSRATGPSRTTPVTAALTKGPIALLAAVKCRLSRCAAGKRARRLRAGVERADERPPHNRPQSSQQDVEGGCGVGRNCVCLRETTAPTGSAFYRLLEVALGGYKTQRLQK
jgi:hypothetical protein